MTDTHSRFGDWVRSWGATLAYGPPTVIGGAEVLPVAIVAFGYGAGELDKAASGGPSAEGGGGSGASVPIGVYVSEHGTTRFVPNTLTVALGIVFVVGTLGVALSSIVRTAAHGSWRHRG